ncbi:hypothetical protein [Haladaptatus sp. NG-SE-30]
MPTSDGSLDTAEESRATRGPIDGPSLFDFRDEFERLEPLATGAPDDVVNPMVLHLTLTDGVGTATDARLDVKWTTRNDYNIHYTDSAGRNLRWDIHPHDYPRPADDRHFHPPPTASNDPQNVAESCIGVTEVELVARGVHALWRRAYDRETFEEINEVENPP